MFTCRNHCEIFFFLLAHMLVCLPAHYCLQETLWNACLYACSYGTYLLAYLLLCMLVHSYLQEPLWNACSYACSFEFFTNTQGWQCWHYCQLCVHIYLQFSSLFTTTDVSKYEIRNQWVYDHCILRSNATLDWLILSNRAKTKLAMLAFLYCGEIVKNTIIVVIVANCLLNSKILICTSRFFRNTYLILHDQQ